MKNTKKNLLLIVIFTLVILTSQFIIRNDFTTIKSDDNSEILTNDNSLANPYALENNGSVFTSNNGSDPWAFTGNAPIGYDFVSTAVDNNHTYVLTSDGQIWRHSNSTWKASTWSKLLIPLPIRSSDWVSIDVSFEAIYVLKSDGDVYRINKTGPFPGWPWPSTWVRSSNPIPINAGTMPGLIGGETSFVSLAVDWNDSFCFVLKNDGKVYRHESEYSGLWGFTGGWTFFTSAWVIYQSWGGPAPFTLEHNDGMGSNWGIPSTGWVSIDVFDNYFEMNYSVYVLHNSGLVARKTNLLGWAIDAWVNPIDPWVLDPRWFMDYIGPWLLSTAFVSIACNDLEIFILKNTGEVFWIPEFDFTLMAMTPTWSWGPSPIIPPLEWHTSAFVSIDAWNEPFILKNDGKEWQNLNWSIGGTWDGCWDNKQNNGKGTLYPNVFSYSSIAAYNINTLFILSKNGTIYNSTDSGISWNKFGNFGYGNDSAWVSIAAANHKNHTYIYALYNNGTVVRTTVGTFSPQSWGNCDNTGIPPDTSWVSITLDGNATVYTLRNLGYITFIFQGGLWQSKSLVNGNYMAHQDSSWVSIGAYHVTKMVFALRNDEILDQCGTGKALAWGNINPTPGTDTSFVAICQTPNYILTLRNNGLINSNLVATGTIPGDNGFVDICYYIDSPPWSNHPIDVTVPNIGTHYIPWQIYDDDSVMGNYYIRINGTLTNFGAIPGNGSTINIWINNTKFGIYNYTILFTDSENQKGTDTVFVTVDFYPWGNSSGNTTTNYKFAGPSMTNWTLYDDYGSSHYRVLINGTPSSWLTWSNGTLIQYPINRTTIGIYNYTIQYNDSINQFNTSTVWITVNDPYVPWSNFPSNIITDVYGSETINWSLWDGYASGYYRVLKDNSPSNWQMWSNGTNLQCTIDRSAPGIFNYTIEYNDSNGNNGPPDTVFVTVIGLPESNHPTDKTVYQNSISSIDWILTDYFGSGYFRAIINGTPGQWNTWTNNTAIDYPINTTTIGIFNYTIQYNNSNGLIGIIDTIIIKVALVPPTTGGIPGFMFIFVFLSIISLVILKKKVKIYF